MEIRVSQRHLRRRKRKLRVPREPLRLPLRFHVVERVKILHFPGDSALEPGRIEEGNRADSALTGNERFPECLEPGPVRREHAHARHNDSIPAPAVASARHTHAGN